MPTSVLLAVLAAASLLALAPALVRRYDATERLAAERTTSTARVLARRRSRRTIPGRYPVNPPRSALSVWIAAESSADAGSSVAPRTRGTAGAAETDGGGRRQASTGPRRLVGRQRRSVGKVGLRPAARAAGRPAVRSRRRPPSAVHRRRRVFAALVLLNAVEVVGVVLVGPGMWISFAVTATVLVAYMVHLRNRAIVAAAERRRAARRARWVAAQQAAVRREHERRAAERRDAQRRATAEREAARREAVRRATEYVERYSRLDRAVGEHPYDPGRPARRGVQRDEPHSPLRGRPYEHPGH